VAVSAMGWGALAEVFGSWREQPVNIPAMSATARHRVVRFMRGSLFISNVIVHRRFGLDFHELHG